jgi:hypothetical protein
VKAHRHWECEKAFYPTGGSATLDVKNEGRRPDLSQPRPTAWERKPVSGYHEALKGRNIAAVEH